jgi:hypothetical protein
VQQELTIAESQLRDYQSRLGAPFPHEAYLSRLTDLRDQLKAGLSGAPAEPGTEAPTVSAIAEQIKALKSEYTIEATPQRTAQRRTSAEEPVTARIRRRAESNPVRTPVAATDTCPSQGEIARLVEAESTAIPSHHTPGGTPQPQSPVTKLSHFSVCVPRQPALFLADNRTVGGFMAKRKLTAAETPDAETSQPVAGNSDPNRQWVSTLPEPHGRHGIDLGDGRRLVLSLSRRWYQNMIQFLATKEGVDPKPSKEDRFARSKSDREAEDQFVTLANAIRGRNGLEPTEYSFGAVVAR